MKKFTFTLVALVVTLCVMAQTKFWVYNNDGTQTEFLISNVDSISFTNPFTPTPAQVTDACNNTYPVVKIGEQYWMAENLKCNKYATQSEAYKASWLKDNTVPTFSEKQGYTPYYIDVSDKSKWDSYSKEYGVNLTNEQVSKLGYLYNWAAAVGIADGQKQTTAFSGNRQGICPNGWHVPSRSEWQTLYDLIYKDTNLSSNTVGKYLKTTSGWYVGGNGLDSYGFAALPAGVAGGSEEYNVGVITSFCTANPYESGSRAYDRDLDFASDGLYDGHSSKSDGLSVRCLMDNESPTPTPTEEKCKASDYPQVTIGIQVWMAENYRCSKYDTQSEAYKEGRYTIPTSESSVFTPYYTDASDKSKWYLKGFASNLKEEQVAKLGYLYNWAAAVGVADIEKQTTAFSGNRQGICPNGWHVPSREEWQTLVDYIEKTDVKGTDTAGKHLKTTSGWYSGVSDYKPGLDTYGFAALPASNANGSIVSDVGDGTYFWTATLWGSKNASCLYIFYNNDYLGNGGFDTNGGHSVRCLKD